MTDRATSRAARRPAARRRLGKVGLARPPAWMLAGRCAQPGADPDAWFPERGTWTRANTAALITCRACPVRAACLGHALEHGEWHGIWGGLTTIQRRRAARTGAA